MENEEKLIRQVPSDEIDLIQFLKLIWQNKWLIVFVTIVFSIGAVIYSKSLPNIYRSEALVAPVTEKKDGLGGLSQLGGLASLAGINVGGGGGIDKQTLAIETMKSREFLTQFIKNHEILPILLAEKDYDVKGQPIFDENIYNHSSKQWLKDGKPIVPSIQKACDNFLGITNITPDNKTKMVHIAIEHRSAEIARQWVTWLIADINEVMKQRDTEEARKSISYLNEQIANTNIADIRAILFQLIEEQTKTMMLVNVRSEYIFKTIDPAIAPEQKSKPKRSVICIAGVILGLAMGMAISLLKNRILDRRL